MSNSEITKMYYRFLFSSPTSGRVVLEDDKGKELGTCGYFSSKNEMIGIVASLSVMMEHVDYDIEINLDHPRVSR